MECLRRNQCNRNPIAPSSPGRRGTGSQASNGARYGGLVAHTDTLSRVLAPAGCCCLGLGGEKAQEEPSVTRKVWGNPLNMTCTLIFLFPAKKSHGALRMNATKDQAKPGRTFSDRAGEPSGLGDYGLWSAPAAVQHESPYKNTSPALLLLLPRRGCPLGPALFGGGTGDSGLLHRRAHHQTLATVLMSSLPVCLPSLRTALKESSASAVQVFDGERLRQRESGGTPVLSRSTARYDR
ncbi:unnamed protein product [Arctogadus glacialis]